MWYLLSCSSSENSHEESQGARTRGNSCSQGAQKAGQESQWGVAEGQQLPSISIHYFLLSLSFFSSQNREKILQESVGTEALGRAGLGYQLQLDSTSPLWKGYSDININISTWFSVFGGIYDHHLLVIRNKWNKWKLVQVLMSSESRKQFGEVVFATGPVSTSLPSTLASSPENRSLRLQQAAACLQPQWKRWGSWGWWGGWGRGSPWAGRWRRRAPRAMGSPPRLCRDAPKVTAEQTWSDSNGNPDEWICKGGRNGKQYVAKHWLTVVVLVLAAACVTLLLLLQQANAEVGYYFEVFAEKKQISIHNYVLLVNKLLLYLNISNQNNSHFKRGIQSK